MDILSKSFINMSKAYTVTYLVSLAKVLQSGRCVLVLVLHAFATCRTC